MHTADINIRFPRSRSNTVVFVATGIKMKKKTR